MKKIYITGISGTGKTTIAKELEKRGFYSISIDEIPNLCYWINKKTKEKVLDDVILNKDFIDAHDWVCDIDYLKKLMNKDTNIIFVLGIASNQKEYLDLFDKILLLQCKPNTFIERIDNRTDNDFGKDKTAQQTILNWYNDFEKNILSVGAVSINVDKSINEIIEQIKNQVI